MSVRPLSDHSQVREPARIPLYRSDGTVQAYALVDPDDFDRLGHHRWLLGGRGYVLRSVQRSGQRQWIRLHRDVMGLGAYCDDKRQVDHINLDRLDNRKANLRVVTFAENMQNRAPRIGNHSKYRGVSWNARVCRWFAYVNVDGKRTYLGYFDDEDEAGRVAAEFRAQHMPFSADAARAA